MRVDYQIFNQVEASITGVWLVVVSLLEQTDTTLSNSN